MIKECRSFLGYDVHEARNTKHLIGLCRPGSSSDNEFTRLITLNEPYDGTQGIGLRHTCLIGCRCPRVVRFYRDQFAADQRFTGKVIECLSDCNFDLGIPGNGNRDHG